MDDVGIGLRPLGIGRRARVVYQPRRAGDLKEPFELLGARRCRHDQLQSIVTQPFEHALGAARRPQSRKVFAAEEFTAEGHDLFAFRRLGRHAGQRRQDLVGPHADERTDAQKLHAPAALSQGVHPGIRMRVVAVDERAVHVQEDCAIGHARSVYRSGESSASSASSSTSSSSSNSSSAPTMSSSERPTSYSSRMGSLAMEPPPAPAQQGGYHPSPLGHTTVTCSTGILRHSVADYNSCVSISSRRMRLVALLVVVLASPAAAQTAASKPWTATTSEGKPDLQGVWTNATLTPLERPARFAGRAVMTEAEAAELESQAVTSFEQQAADRAPGRSRTARRRRGRQLQPGRLGRPGPEGRRHAPDVTGR